jgi:peptidoglycan/xylan/chitin deacetylase (PgdA/CDA1 family)
VDHSDPRAAQGDEDVLVLCYHALSEDFPAALSVTPQAFEFQIGLLASRGYRGATFSEAALGAGPGKVAAITFDDGYRSVDRLARPILERFGFPATVFVPTAYVGSEGPLSWPGIEQWSNGPHQDELVPMSWPELRALTEAGWEIGSHTVSHPHLTGVDEETLRGELADSRQRCAEMIGACTSIAFPYGDCDARVLDAARDAGYSAAGLLATELGRQDRFACPRIGVYHSDGRRAFRAKVSPTVRRLRESSLWPPIAKLMHRIRRG